ncbi:chemotaxis protein CheV [Metabacillus sp. KIGAM252]|uniref:Chemotaxis protein CheV n=1 Tax=Metabacillus flavus TaxID=2823519 RepID=A0ABS5LD34_9BACI|nr:chemotaxis protein [Metabacillus flavus]MBS2968642.1 chemotaxis protein CheV [Metabacillus flavus]
MEMNKGILLDSGTNELELVEFLIGENRFGINVIKVKEIIQPAEVTAVPHSHPNVAGIMELRGEVLPVIHTAKALNLPDKEPTRADKFIVTEFNNQKLIFHVHGVTQIHRVTWDHIEKPTSMYQGLEAHVTGVVQLNEKMVLMLDFEKIVVDIDPSSGLTIDRIKKLGKRERSEKKIAVAEDSPMLRKLLKETLKEAGFTEVEFFENGRDALEFLENMAAADGPMRDRIQLVITDIEMPQMDGHHLTKRIKENSRLQELPVIIFSSLITNDLMHKGVKVGAAAQVSKPEIDKLVALIDQFIL